MPISFSKRDIPRAYGPRGVSGIAGISGIPGIAGIPGIPRVSFVRVRGKKIKAIPVHDGSQVVAVCIYCISITPGKPTDPVAVGVEKESILAEGYPHTTGVE
jgi:hypothetical protein